jgi:hypothetical protein
MPLLSYALSLSPLIDVSIELATLTFRGVLRQLLLQVHAKFRFNQVVDRNRRPRYYLQRQ